MIRRKKMIKRLVVIAMVAVLFFAAHTGKASADLVTNGSFTTGDFTGWTISGNTGGTSWYFVNNDGLSYTPPAPSAYYAQFGSSGSPTFISQTLTTTVGQAYTVSFYLSNDMPASPGNNNEFQVLWNGALGTPHLVNTNAFTWTEYQFTATATGSSTPISFGFQNDAGVFDITAVKAAPVPVPAALLLFGPGLAGIAIARRKLKN
jgi:hypothetical protein